LRGNLLLGITHGHCPLYSQDVKLDLRQRLILTRFRP
jgi:hypothetical protein